MRSLIFWVLRIWTSRNFCGILWSKMLDWRGKEAVCSLDLKRRSSISLKEIMNFWLISWTYSVIIRYLCASPWSFTREG